MWILQIKLRGIDVQIICFSFLLAFSQDGEQNSNHRYWRWKTMLKWQ